MQNVVATPNVLEPPELPPAATIRVAPSDGPFLSALNKQLTFQRQWRKLMMSLYTFSTAGTIISTSTAALMAALNYSVTAAILAGVGTVLVSLEKSLLFRERWRLHIRIVTLLEGLEVDYTTGRISLEQGAERHRKIMDDYAEQVPVREREE